MEIRQANGSRLHQISEIISSVNPRLRPGFRFGSIDLYNYSYVQERRWLFFKQRTAALAISILRAGLPVDGTELLANNHYFCDLSKEWIDLDFHVFHDEIREDAELIAVEYERVSGKKATIVLHV